MKILIAGCLPKDRMQIEGAVRKAFVDMPESDPWNVSLVKLGTSWSISLEGPEARFQGLSLTASEDRLQETIAEALGANGARGGTASPTLEELEAAEGLLVEVAEVPLDTTTDMGTGDRYDCSACGQPFVVVYTAQPRDAKIMAPVACPKCWQLTKVSIPESVAATEEYRAEAIPG